MMTRKQFFEIAQATRVLRAPRHRISTFGATEIEYHLVSPLGGEPARSMRRSGLVKASRPQILAREALERRFDGFGDEADEFSRWLAETGDGSLRALEYTFKNELRSATAHGQDARALADGIAQDIDGRAVPRTVLLLGPEEGWQFSLMKFILEEAWRSFRSNVQELEDRGLFDPARARLESGRREIEALFAAARRDRDALGALSRRLKEQGLFDQYQDRFFELVRNT